MGGIRVNRNINAEMQYKYSFLHKCIYVNTLVKTDIAKYVNTFDNL